MQCNNETKHNEVQHNIPHTITPQQLPLSLTITYMFHCFGGFSCLFVFCFVLNWQACSFQMFGNSEHKMQEYPVSPVCFQGSICLLVTTRVMLSAPSNPDENYQLVTKKPNDFINNILPVTKVIWRSNATRNVLVKWVMCGWLLRVNTSFLISLIDTSGWVLIELQWEECAVWQCKWQDRSAICRVYITTANTLKALIPFYVFHI